MKNLKVLAIVCIKCGKKFEVLIDGASGYGAAILGLMDHQDKCKDASFSFITLIDINSYKRSFKENNNS